MKRLFFILFLLPCFSFGQPFYFNKIYDCNSQSDHATATVEAWSGGFFLPITSYNPNELVLKKIDESGFETGSTSYSISGYHYGIGGSSSLIRTLDSNYVLCGSIQDSLGNQDAFVMKFDENGDTLWTRKYGGPNFDIFLTCTQTNDSGYAFIGGTYSFGIGLSNFYLVKTDSAGNTQWSQAFGQAGESAQAISGQQTLDGGYILAGTKSGANYVVKTDSAGNFDWGRLYPTSDGACTITQLVDSTYITAGSYNDGVDYTWTQGCLRKIDKDGTEIWYKCYGKKNHDYFRTEPLILGDGSIIVAGETHNQQAATSGWLFKASAIGDSLWSRTYYYGTSSSNSFYDLEMVNDGGFIISGVVLWSTQDGWLVKVNNEGNPWPVKIPYCPGPNPKINVYPNPTTGTFTVQGATGEIQVYDLFGRLVLTATKPQVDMRAFPKGVYIVRAGEAAQKLILHQ